MDMHQWNLYFGILTFTFCIWVCIVKFGNNIHFPNTPNYTSKWIYTSNLLETLALNSPLRFGPCHSSNVFISPANWGRSKALTPWSLTSPLKRYLKVVFQPPFIRGYVKLRVCKAKCSPSGSLNFCVVCTLVVSPRIMAKSAWQSRVVEKKGDLVMKTILSYQAHDIHDASYQKGRKDRIVPVETFICSEIGLIWWWRIIIAYKLYPGFIHSGRSIPARYLVSSGLATACHQRQTSNWKHLWHHRTSVVLFLPTINLSK